MLARVWEVRMSDEQETEQSILEEGRHRARAGLPYILPDRPGKTGSRRRSGGEGEDTGLLFDGADPRAQTRAERRQSVTAQQREETRRRRRGLAPDDDDTPRQKPDPKRRSGAPDDALVRRVAPLIPAYDQLVNVCDVVDPKRARFIADYCAKLQTASRDDRGVSRAELAELAAREPFGWSVQWAYKTLRWAHHLFREWAFAEYQTGHVFTPAEMSPIQKWLESVNGASAPDPGEEPDAP